MIRGYLFASSSSASVKRSDFAQSRTLARAGFMATGTDPVLLITKEMLDAAQNWHARSDPKKEDPDIWTGRLSCPI